MTHTGDRSRTVNDSRCTHPDHVSDGRTTCEDRAVACSQDCPCCLVAAARAMTRLRQRADAARRALLALRRHLARLPGHLAALPDEERVRIAADLAEAARGLRCPACLDTGWVAEPEGQFPCGRCKRSPATGGDGR